MWLESYFVLCLSLLCTFPTLLFDCDLETCSFLMMQVTHSFFKYTLIGLGLRLRLTRDWKYGTVWREIFVVRGTPNPSFSYNGQRTVWENSCLACGVERLSNDNGARYALASFPGLPREGRPGTHCSRMREYSRMTRHKKMWAYMSIVSRFHCTAGQVGIKTAWECLVLTFVVGTASFPIVRSTWVCKQTYSWISRSVFAAT